MLDFLNVIQVIFLGFATLYRTSVLTDYVKTMEDLITHFKTHLRADKSFKSRTSGGGTHGAFSVTFQGKGLDGNRLLPNCKCGDEHFYRNCPYLEPSKRPRDWKPDLHIQERMNKFKEQRDKRRRRFQPNQRSQKLSQSQELGEIPSSENDEQEAGTYAFSAMAATVVTPTVFYSNQELNRELYALRDSFILDSGVTMHICNNRSRFTDIREASPHV